MVLGLRLGYAIIGYVTTFSSNSSGFEVTVCFGTVPSHLKEEFFAEGRKQ